MLLVYDILYSLHKGFLSSLENPERIEKTISILKAISIEKNIKTLPKPILNKFYEDVKTLNCEYCTFTCSLDRKRCDICQSSLSSVKLVSKIEGDTTYMNKDSEKCIQSLAETIINTLEIQIRYRKDIFILTRPPGHHCDNVNPKGFCIFNNIFFGAEYLVKKGFRIAIVDWDVHYGDGTAKLCKWREDILFIDIHREDIYPFEKTDIGLKKGSGEQAYLNAFYSIIIPKLKNFNPNWILVSCGFDAHKKDPIGGMNLETDSYVKFTKLLQELGKPITLFLEGGYDKDVILDCVSAIINKC